MVYFIKHKSDAVECFKKFYNLVKNQFGYTIKVLKTPLEAWTGRKPDLEHIRVFGSVAYTHVPDQRRSKLDVKSRKLILVGYDGESNNYRLFDPVNKKITISRNVIFVEDVESDKDPNRSYMSFEFKNANIKGNEDVASERSGDKEEEEYLEEIESEQVPNLRPRQNIKPRKRYELNLVENDIPQIYEETTSDTLVTLVTMYMYNLLYVYV
ncbi:hypothetical protein QE152_g26941 [Popillia japonica]|uniref:Retroviral polymerase SH3-like domain-containing protein n=1 Tax=Popillia japonica TaxID=7064 RepID=A0AAW1JWI8_POPJA